MTTYGQLGQDKFVIEVLEGKQNGYYLEIGSNHPKKRSNTYLLESEFNWTGIMIERDESFLALYKRDRPKSTHVICDATNIDYNDLFTKSKTPRNIDYLQIDLEVIDNSSLTTLKKISTQVMSDYKFAAITFEHDMFSLSHTYALTRKKSRKILKQQGYYIVFSDVYDKKIGPLEDWYVHPELVNMENIKKLQEVNECNYFFCNTYKTRVIDWQSIDYVYKP
jgi:hypothetical protein